jgi:uncharacterized protein (TIGR00296 family)
MKLNKKNLLKIPRKILEWDGMIYGETISEEKINILLDKFFNKYTFNNNLENYGIFITIDKYDKEKKILNLRGCIGTFILQKNIPRAIAKYTLYSAFRDSRFKPIEKSELEDLIYKVNFLEKPENLNTIKVNEISNKMKFGREKGHGITMYFNNGTNSTYLSSVLPDHFGIYDKKTLIEKWDELVNSLKEKSSGMQNSKVKLENVEIYLCKEFDEKEKLDLIGGNKLYYYKINYKNRN